MKKALATLLTLALFAGVAAAGTLSAGLERQIRGMDDSAEIKVLVVMQDQVDIRSLDWQLHDAKAGFDTRHRIVVEELQKTAANSQQSLLAALEADKAGGPVRGYTSHWLINGVIVVTTVEHVRVLAARPDVDVIEANLEVELIEPIKSQKRISADKAIGIAPGVVDVGARRVWDELGIDGTGALVGILDTGVDGTHAALSGNWHGNTEPADECWFDAIGDGSTTPTDTHYHGTHVMGTICGLAANDTIGVAPGATWIASNVINQGASAEFDSDVLNSLAFMTDPDGDPGTTDDVPDVVQNSWGVNEGFTGYVDCDSRWWTAIDACEAAGVVLTWSAGNEGSGSTSMRSPADRATNAYNCFSVGSTNHTAPYTVSGFSSRGPAGPSCGDAQYLTKPEIMAPGDNIYSAQPGGGYQLLSGTSMAGPHIAGVVALMRAANPGLDVITIKQILMDTAVDMGVAGDDNDHGHGFVDGYAAVLAVMAGYGTLEGYVTDAGTGNPIAGASVVASSTGENDRGTTTDATGYYSFMLPEATWNVDASFFGYYDNGNSATVVADATVQADIALTQAPTSVVSGTVLMPDGVTGADGATVKALGTPLPIATAGPTGFYSMNVPDGGTYTFQARLNGFSGDRHTVAVSGATTVDFQLSELTHEDFETGDFSNYPWVMGGTAPWVIDTAVVYEGVYSAKSGTISHNQTSEMSVDLDLNDGDFSFWYKVSSESGWDYLRFSVDGVEQSSWSGEIDWTMHTVSLTAGTHTLTWAYTKDGSVSNGSDAAWVDFIGEPVYPEIAVNPLMIQDAMAPNNTADHTVTISNLGAASLQWTAQASIHPAPVAAAAPHPPLELGKDEIDPRPSMAPVLGAGGPDTFGYNWIDSDDPSGPTFDWVEINTIGTPHTYSDDQIQTFTLPFGFSFYGTVYTDLIVSSNGWVAFSSSTSDYTNDPIPSASDPNALIAVYWDDFNPSTAGTIYTYDDAANNRFIVEWDGVPFYSTSTYNTFQVILNADGSIKCQYLIAPDRASATFGLENAAGDDGLQISYNVAYAHDGLAVEYFFQAPWVTVMPMSGSTPAFGSTDLTVTLDSTDLADGIYEGHVLISSNDPANAEIIVPVELTVSTSTAVGDELPSRYNLGAAVPNPFNPMTKISFAVPSQSAHVSLQVFDVSGRLVRTLVSGPLGAGTYTATWAGDDDQGRRVASGTYFYSLNAGAYSETKKMVLVK